MPASGKERGANLYAAFAVIRRRTHNAAGNV